MQLTAPAPELHGEVRQRYFTVGANGVIVLGPPTVFTKDNVANFNF